MNFRDKLFTKKSPYQIDEKANHLFFLAAKENFTYQYNHCKEYKRIMDASNFSPERLKSYDDIANIPPIPTLYFKTHKMFSMKKNLRFITATSSGTSSGQNKSVISLNFKACIRGLKMVLAILKPRKLFTLKPARHVIFGYEYNRHATVAFAKTGYGTTFLAPAISRDYALRYTKDGYKLDLEHIKKVLIKYSKGRIPVRTAGFPAYTYFLLKQMKEEGIALKLPKGSILTIGGGWKQFYAEKVEKKDFYKIVYDVLGIEEKNIVEYFGAVEHPVLYADCENHHFHISKYSRVIIRDVKTLKPLGYNKVGLINLITPYNDATPILSVMTDDLGILYDDKCSCGINTPYLEIIGRVGVSGIVTCAAGADEYLKKEK